MTDLQPQYPLLLLERDGAEIIACGPFRFRLLYQGNHVHTFKLFTDAVRYMLNELV